MLKRNSFIILLLVLSLVLSRCIFIKKDKTIVPDYIIVTDEHTANDEADAIEDKYKNALKVTVDQLKNLYFIDEEYSEDIIVEKRKDSITFTSTVSGEIKGDKNRYVRLGFKDGQGQLSLTALEGKTGKIGVDLVADLDLTNTTNGFYVRLKKDGEDAGHYHRESAGVFYTDTAFPTYTTNAVDNAYIELTIPWQGSVTVKGIYLYMESEIRGFAGMEETITGGEGALEEDTYNVSNGAEFYSALQEIRKNPTTPAIIYVDGIITKADYWSAAGGSRTRPSVEIGGDVENLSIIGVGTNGIFDGLGLKIQGTNTVIQNITVRKVLDGDGIEINNAKYVKIDHCTLHSEPPSQNSDKDKYDELISIKNNAEYIVLSWNHLYDSHKTILIGSNDGEDAQPDRKVIMHHNLIKDCNSRLPLFRGGHGHIYNNYYRNNPGGTGINCRTGSKILIENNYFENIKDPIGYWFDTQNPSGLYQVRDNEFNNCTGNQPTESTITMKFEDGYNPKVDPVGDVPSIVREGAGVGKI